MMPPGARWIASLRMRLPRQSLIDLLHQAAPCDPACQELRRDATGVEASGLRLVPGLVVAIEPWFLAGCIDKCDIDPNGWTVRSTDGSRAAHVEHTVAITSDGPVILTV